MTDHDPARAVAGSVPNPERETEDDDAAEVERILLALWDEAAGFLLRLHTMALADHLDMEALMNLALDVGEWANDPTCVRMQLDRLFRVRANAGSPVVSLPEEQAKP